MIPEQEKCVKSVWQIYRHSRARCSRRGKHEYRGMKYCWQHFPPNVEKKDAEANAAYYREKEEFDRNLDLEQAQQKVLALTAKFHTTMDSGTLALWMMSEGPGELFEAVGKLKRLGWKPEEDNDENKGRGQAAPKRI